MQEELDAALVSANVRPEMTSSEMGALARLFNKLDTRKRGFVDMNDMDLWNPDVEIGNVIFDAFMR